MQTDAFLLKERRSAITTNEQRDDCKHRRSQKKANDTDDDVEEALGGMLAIDNGEPAPALQMNDKAHLHSTQTTLRMDEAVCLLFGEMKCVFHVGNVMLFIGL